MGDRMTPEIALRLVAMDRRVQAALEQGWAADHPTTQTGEQ
jgi:hypothetical protein